MTSPPIFFTRAWTVLIFHISAPLILSSCSNSRIEEGAFGTLPSPPSSSNGGTSGGSGGGAVPLTVSINQALGQADPATAVPATFTVTFSRSIDAASFGSSDISQGGTSTGVVWTITDSGDQTTFTLSATDATSNGTLIPSISAGLVSAADDATTNDASTSTDSEVTLNVAAPSGLSYSAATAIYVYNSFNAALTQDISNNSPTVTGAVTRYSIAGAGVANATAFTAATGLSFSTSTGVISGKASVTRAAQDYTITAANPGGSTSATVNIRTGPGFLVNSTADTDDDGTTTNDCDADAGAARVCTLRAAISQLNTGASATTHLVVVPAGTYNIGNTLSLSSPYEIIGDSKTTTILDGASGNSIFTLNANSIISNFTIRNARDSSVKVSGGTSHSLNSIIFDSNYDSVGTEGGAIKLSSGTLTVTEGQFLNNISGGRGGAIFASNGTTLRIYNSYFFNNSTDFDDCGGIYSNGSTLTIEGSLFEANGSTEASALYLANFSAATITNTTFTAHTGTSSVILATGGAHSCTNCTIAGNSAGNTLNDTATVQVTSGSFTFRNSIVADNLRFQFGLGMVSSTGCDGAGTFTSTGTNIFEHNGCGFAAGDSFADPSLAALADNGGYTKTMALNVGSVALDTGSNATCPAHDQRGPTFTRPVNTTCDKGAFERQ